MYSGSCNQVSKPPGGMGLDMVKGESQATELRVESGLSQERQGCFWLPCQGVEAYPGLSET